MRILILLSVLPILFLASLLVMYFNKRVDVLNDLIAYKRSGDAESVRKLALKYAFFLGADNVKWALKWCEEEDSRTSA